MGGRAAAGSYFAAGLAVKWLPLRPGQSPVDLPAFSNALGPDDRIRFVGVNSYAS